MVSSSPAGAGAQRTPPRFTVSTVCLREHDLPAALERAHALGFDTVDLVGLRGLCEHVPINGTARDMRRAARDFLGSGLRAASVNADPGSYDGADAVADVDRRVELILDFAHETGTPLVVLPAGEKRELRGDAPQLDRMVDSLNRAAVRAWERGVRLAVEAPYFGRPVDRVDGAAALLAGLDPEIGVAFDVSHIEAADESVVDAWRLLGPRVAVVHLRDAVSGDIRRVIGAGRVDFAAAFAAMDASGYEGDVVLELETRNSPYATKDEEVLAAVAHLEPLAAGIRAEA